jgi:hypothetical protein
MNKMIKEVSRGAQHTCGAKKDLKLRLVKFFLLERISRRSANYSYFDVTSFRLVCHALSFLSTDFTVHPNEQDKTKTKSVG